MARTSNTSTSNTYSITYSTVVLVNMMDVPGGTKSQSALQGILKTSDHDGSLHVQGFGTQEANGKLKAYLSENFQTTANRRKCSQAFLLYGPGDGSCTLASATAEEIVHISFEAFEVSPRDYPSLNILRSNKEISSGRGPISLKGMRLYLKVLRGNQFCLRARPRPRADPPAPSG